MAERTCQEIFIEAYSKVAFAKLYDRKTLMQTFIAACTREDACSPVGVGQTSQIEQAHPPIR